MLKITYLKKIRNWIQNWFFWGVNWIDFGTTSLCWQLWKTKTSPLLPFNVVCCLVLDLLSGLIGLLKTCVLRTWCSHETSQQIVEYAFVMKLEIQSGNNLGFSKAWHSWLMQSSLCFIQVVELHHFSVMLLPTSTSWKLCFEYISCFCGYALQRVLLFWPRKREC